MSGADQKVVLVVDDEEVIRGMVSSILQLTGYRVLVAQDAETAKQVASRCQVHVLLTDIVMPGQNGFDLARELSAASGLKVVFMSGTHAYVPDDFPPETIVIRKPFGIQDMLDSVKKTIEA